MKRLLSFSFLILLAASLFPADLRPTLPLVLVAEVKSPELAGVGLMLGSEGGRIVVKHVVTNSPAFFSQAIETNDVVVAIMQGDGEIWEVAGHKLEEVVQHIRGPERSVVRLTIARNERDTESLRVVTLVRGLLPKLLEWGNGPTLPVGTTIPESQWTRISNKTTEAFSGSGSHVVVLEFWATWCGPCIQSWGLVEKEVATEKEWAGLVEFWAVSLDDEIGTVEKFVSHKGWNNQRIVWGGTAMGKEFHVASLPMVYVIDRDRKVAEVGHLSPTEVRTEVARLLARAKN